jgi:hypothetical protein
MKSKSKGSEGAFSQLRVKSVCSVGPFLAAIGLAYNFRRCPETVLFEATTEALLGKRIFNDADRR